MRVAIPRDQSVQLEHSDGDAIKNMPLANETEILFQFDSRAEEAQQSTKLTFSQPIVIPGRILPAGTYLFRLADSNDLNLVQIFNAEGTRLYAVLQTIAAEHPAPTRNTRGDLWSVGVGT